MDISIILVNYKNLINIGLNTAKNFKKTFNFKRKNKQQKV